MLYGLTAALSAWVCGVMTELIMQQKNNILFLVFGLGGAYKLPGFV
jgi:hypothetical protein